MDLRLGLSRGVTPYNRHSQTFLLTTKMRFFAIFLTYFALAGKPNSRTRREGRPHFQRKLTPKLSKLASELDFWNSKYRNPNPVSRRYRNSEDQFQDLKIPKLWIVLSIFWGTSGIRIFCSRDMDSRDSELFRNFWTFF